VKVLINEKNAGAPTCRNQGFAIANAPFVMFLDADDYVEGLLLQSMLDAILKDDADLVFGSWALEWEDGHREQRVLPRHHDAAVFIADWLKGNYVPPCSVLWRRTFLQHIGGWDEDLRKNQDGDLVYRAICAGAKVATCTSGSGIYCQYTSDYRISYQGNRETLESRNIALERLLAAIECGCLDTRRSNEVKPDYLKLLIAREYYICAVDAFNAGYDDNGNEYLTKARYLGFRGHIGSTSKRCIARVVGIRRFYTVKRTLKRLIFSPTRFFDS
jgi:glycosyltransferase involved in cell wall biosynthesis